MSNPPRQPDAESVTQALRTVQDPEHGINIVDLGLVYRVAIDDRHVLVEMTLTSPACPMGSQMVEDARAAVGATVPEGWRVEVEVVWEPPWGPERMSDSARAHFGWS